MNFELLGHECPTGSYPGPVVPIGILDGQRLASFRDGEIVKLEPLKPDAQYIEHSKEVRERLRGYKVEEDALFAFNETDIVFYKIQDEALFFDNLLWESVTTDRVITDPFFRLSIASATGYTDTITRELITTTQAMAEEASEFIVEWYQNTMVKLSAQGLSKGGWPCDANELLTRVPKRIPVPARRLLSQFKDTSSAARVAISELREAVSKSSGNGRVNLLDENLESQFPREACVLFTGGRKSTVRKLLHGLLDELDHSDGGGNGTSILDIPNDSTTWIAFGDKRELVRHSEDVDDVEFELRMPARLCALGFRFVEMSPLPLFAESGRLRLLLSQIDLLVFVIDESDYVESYDLSLILDDLSIIPDLGERTIVAIVDRGDDGNRLSSGRYLASSASSVGRVVIRGGVAEMPDSQGGYFARTTAGLSDLEELLAKRALQMSYKPQLLRRLRSSIHVGTEHVDFLRRIIPIVFADRDAATERYAALRSDYSTARVRLVRRAQQAQNQVEKEYELDFRRFIEQCKEIANSVVKQWRLPGEGLVMLTALQTSAFNRSISVLIRELEQKIDLTFQEFCKALSAKIVAIGGSMDLISHSQVAMPTNLQFNIDNESPRFDGLRNSMNLSGTFVNMLSNMFPIAGLAAIGSLFGPIIYRVSFEDKIRSALLHGSPRNTGLLEMIDEWAARTGVAVLERATRVLEEVTDYAAADLRQQEVSIGLALEQLHAEKQELGVRLSSHLSAIEFHLTNLKEIATALAAE